MSQLEQTQSRYRSLRMSAAADELVSLLAQAEANEALNASSAFRWRMTGLAYLKINVHFWVIVASVSMTSAKATDLGSLS